MWQQATPFRLQNNFFQKESRYVKHTPLPKFHLWHVEKTLPLHRILMHLQTECIRLMVWMVSNMFHSRAHITLCTSQASIFRSTAHAPVLTFPASTDHNTSVLSDRMMVPDSSLSGQSVFDHCYFLHFQCNSCGLSLDSLLVLISIADSQNPL